jgi:hypothetical protein
MLYVPFRSLLDIADSFRSMVAEPNARLHLYTNALPLQQMIVLGDLIEADFGGYAPIDLAAFAAALIDNAGAAFIQAPLTTFTCDGTAPANDVVGYYITNAGAVLWGLEPFPGGPIHMELNTDEIALQPSLALAMFMP